MPFEVFRPARSPRRTGLPAGRHAARDAEIQWAFVAGASRSELAASYGLSHPRICQIVNDLPGDLSAQSVMGATYRGDLAEAQAILARMDLEQLREVSAAAAALASLAGEALTQ